MDFGKILQRAWHIIWNNKILWLFGILASCGSGGGGGGGGNMSFDASSGNYGNVPPEMRRFFLDMERSFNRIDDGQIFWIILGIIAVVILISLLVFLISTFGRVALIKGAKQADGGMQLSFGQLFRDSQPYFLRALGLNFLLGLAVFLIVILGIAFFAIFGTITFGIGLLCLIPLLCLLVPLSIGYRVFAEFSNNALVIEDIGIFEAYRRGWEVLRANLGNMALMALLLLILGLLLGLVAALPMLAVGFSALSVFILNEGRGIFDNLAGLGIGFGLALLVTIFLGGIVRAYISSAWTLTYTDLNAAPALPAKAPRKSPAKKAPAKKAPAKKTPAKKTPAKKRPAKKTPPKKSS